MTYGKGCEDLIEVQRRINESHNLIAEHLRRSTPEDPLTRLRRIAWDDLQKWAVGDDFRVDPSREVKG